MAIKINADTVITDSYTITGLNNWAGTYTNFHPNVGAVTTDIDLSKGMNSKTLASNTTFTISNIATGKVSILLLDISANGYVPTFPSSIKWPQDTEPTWTQARYWAIGLTGWSSSIVRATASAWGS
jgi:hypothetical protein